jgi:hypothetical protein
MASTTVMNLAVAPRVRRATAPKSRVRGSTETSAEPTLLTTRPAAFGPGLQVVCAAAAPKQASMKGAAFLSAAALGLILATAQPAFANVCASNPTGASGVPQPCAWLTGHG